MALFSHLARGLTVFAILLPCSVAGTNEGRPAPIKVVIAAQPLERALNEWAAQTGYSVLVEAQGGVEHMMAPNVAGSLTPEDALRQLLARTGLTYKFIDARTVTIQAAAVGLSSTSLLISKPTGDLRFAQADENAHSAATGAMPPPESDTPLHASLEEIVVTGSRLKRTGAQAQTALTTFDRQRIEQLGVSNVADVLNYLPQQSFSYGERSGFAGTRTVRLRGLGLSSTLVLVNGRRTVTSALLGAGNAFDLNTLPLSMVDRIEVVADSASAVYGADAVGGVVNIISKKFIEKPTLDFYAGQAAGGADEKRASFGIGREGTRARGSIVFDYFQRDFLMGPERERFSNMDYRRFGGVDQRFPYANPGNVCSLDGSNLPGLTSPCAAVPNGSTGLGLTPSDFLATQNDTNLDSNLRFEAVVPKSERFSAAAIGEFDVNEHMTTFGEFWYNNRKDLSIATPDVLADQFVPDTNPFNPFGVPVLVNYLFPNLGGEQSRSEAKWYRGVMGLRGALGEWDWEASLLGTREQGASFASSVVDYDAVGAALDATDPTQSLNVFQDGTAGSPIPIASLLLPPIVDHYSSQAWQVGGFGRGPIFELPGGKTELVIGAEARKEKLLFDSYILVDADRTTSAAFAEMSIPIVGAGNQRRFINELTATLAARYDHYNDFGNTFNPQYGLQWRPVRQLLLRTSYNTSFRAPSLFELFSPQRAFNIFTTDPRRNNEFTPISLITGGNPDLQPEDAHSWTAGLLMTPNQALKIGATYWSITQAPRVLTLFATQVVANESALPGRVVRTAPSPEDIAAGLPGSIISVENTTLNVGRLETDGVDVDMSATLPTALGQFDVSFMTTWVRSFKSATLPNATPIDRVGIASSQGTIPKWKGTATLAWSKKALGLAGTARFNSSYDDVNAFGISNSRRVASQTLVDVQGSLDLQHLLSESSWLEGVTVRGGVINVFNKIPPYSEVSFSSGLDPSQSDARQRFGYLSLTKAF